MRQRQIEDKFRADGGQVEGQGRPVHLDGVGLRPSEGAAAARAGVLVLRQRLEVAVMGGWRRGEEKERERRGKGAGERRGQRCWSRG